MDETHRQSVNRAEALQSLLRERIVILDGAMGTMIQTYRLDEAGYRGERFKDWPSDVKGNNDLLNLTQPHVIQDIHRQYFQAGADIIETNTFNSTTISMADYGMESLAHELNVAGAKNARAAADAIMAAEPGRVCFVAGALGPTSKTASISGDVNNPAARGVTYDQLVAAYYEQARGLVGRRRGSAAGRNGVRFAQLQGRALRHRQIVRRTGRACRSCSPSPSPI